VGSGMASRFSLSPESGGDFWRFVENSCGPAAYRHRFREGGKYGLETQPCPKRGFHLAFELFQQAPAASTRWIYILRGRNARTLITSLSGENAGAQISPDGRKLVFQSDRTGGVDIWVSDRNGQKSDAVDSDGYSRGATLGRQMEKRIAFDVGLGRDWREPRAVFRGGR